MRKCRIRVYVYYYTVDQWIEISITIDKGAPSVGAALILGPTRLRRGRRVAGVELRHLAGQPGGGGD